MRYRRTDVAGDTYFFTVKDVGWGDEGTPTHSGTESTAHVGVRTSPQPTNGGVRRLAQWTMGMTNDAVSARGCGGRHLFLHRQSCRA
jgi:hypothetical protein